MKKVLAICMALVLVVALPLAASALIAESSETIIITSDDYIVGSPAVYPTSTSTVTDVSAVIAQSGITIQPNDPDQSYVGFSVTIRRKQPGDMFVVKPYQYVSLDIVVAQYSPSGVPSPRSSIRFYDLDSSGDSYFQLDMVSSEYRPATADMAYKYVGKIDLGQDMAIDSMRVTVWFGDGYSKIGYTILSVENFEILTGVSDEGAYNTAQIIDQIQTSTDEIIGSIDGSTGQIVGELDEIQSDIKGDDWTSPAPGKDDELNGAMSDYDDAYNEAVGGKSDQEIVDEVSGQVDYDYGALDQQSVSGVTGFLSDLLDSFGADYKSLLMLSLTIGLAVYVIGRRVSSA